MAVRRGTVTPSAIFRGTVPVQKVMRGTVEAWSAYVSPYPLSQGWGPFDLPRFTSINPVSHTIVESGSFTVAVPQIANAQLRLHLNGSRIESLGTGVALSRTLSLAVGDLLELFVYPTVNTTYSGSWSIVKN